MDWNSLWDTVINWITHTGVRLLIALVLLFVSFRIITLVTRKLTKKLKRISEKNANFFISRFFPTFPLFKLEKHKNILYND